MKLILVMEDIMKIYLEKNQIEESDYKLLVSKFPNVEFVDELNKDVEVLIGYPNLITEKNLKLLSKLKWIQLLQAGFNTVDFGLLKRNNIKLTNAKDIYSITIAEDVVCKILVLNRNVKQYLKNMEKGIWERYSNEPEIYGSTIGIIGAGSIGKEIAKRLSVFAKKIIGHRRQDKPVEYFDEIYTGEDGLDEVLKQSDYVILALPLNKDSYHLIDAKKLSLMKPNSVLINIARGEVVKQDDLIEALENKTIRAAGLDVVTPEPLPKDHKLWTLDNVFITPHNSVSSPYISRRLTMLLVENINNYLENNNLKNIVEYL